MTTKPMTPREDVEVLAQRCFAVSQFIARYRSRDEIYQLLEKADTMLRALLAERDAAYQRGQVDMRLTAALKVVSLVNDGCALIDMDVHILALPIKETPDAE